MKQLLMMFAIISVFLVAGCNTMEGVGKDVERAGEEIQDQT